MKTFIIIIFGLSTIRTVMPLTKQEEWTLSRLIVVAITVAAYICLLNIFVNK